MSTRSLKKKLDRVKAALPPPPPPYEELPVEEWLADEVHRAFPDVILENSPDEEYFFGWLEKLPSRLTTTISIRLVKARNEGWTIYDPIPPLPPEVDRRLVDALPPYIERQHRLWIDNFPSREDRRRWVAEMERLSPKVMTRDNGYGWWFRVQENYARLREKYSGFEEEWARFYENWKEKCEREGRNVPMDDRMRGAFIGVCFSRGKHGGEAAGGKS